jgi:choline dehydrogenase-like flavoprotein
MTMLYADVCVVGAGAAGVTVARELAGSTLQVVVLESGGRKATLEADALCELEQDGLSIGPESRQRMLGGTTNTWWGKLATFDPIDLRTRAWVPRSGWPFDRDALEPFYRRAAHVFGLPELADARREDLAPLRGPVLEGEEVRPTHFYWQRPPLNFADVHRRDVEPAANVTTILDATATRFEPGPVPVVRAAVRAGEDLEVRARAVVLAGGGIENARLLLAWGLGNPEVVGRGFMDHPKGECGEVVVTSDSSRLLDRSYWRGRRVGPLRIQRGVGLTEAAQERHGALNSYAMLEPVYAGKHGAGASALRRLYRQRRRSLRGSDLRAMAADLPTLAGAVRFRLFDRGRLERLRLHNFLEQAPDPANRITLADRTDDVGLPVARLTWSVTDLDRHSVRVLHQAIDREVRRRGIGRVESALLDDGGGEGEWTITQDASHHVGTTRMGADPATSVVDPQGRVHGTPGLYVAGSSVFPTSGYANPTFTIVALATRLADELRRTLL